jgi:hypothetical protein
MNKKVRVIGIAVACVGAAALAASISSRFQPSSSPFRNDVITLVNDVGEKVTVPKSTIKPEPKQGKELFKELAEVVKEDLKNSSKPVIRADVLACMEADSKSAEAANAQTAADSWRSNMFGETLAQNYDQQAAEYRAEAADKEEECMKKLAESRKEREAMRLDATASKQLISLAATPGSYAKYVPTYSYKVIVTDINGRSNVTPQTKTCLNPDSINIFSQERRKGIAPYAFVSYSKPQQISIVTSTIDLPEVSRFDGAVIPTQDALNLAAQAVCNFKGHSSVEKVLAN